MSLTNQDYADYDLLQVIDNEPRSRTEDLATVLDTELRSVASRLAWMLRMELCERTTAGVWTLTRHGKELLNGRAAEIDQVRKIAKHASRSDTMAWVFRREFRRGL